MQRLYMIASFVAVACGGFMIWMAYGFASMIDPDLQGADARSETLRKLFTDGGGTIGFGILLICAGLWLAVSKQKPSA